MIGFGLLMTGCSPRDEEREEVGKIVFEEDEEDEWNTSQHGMSHETLSEGGEERLFLEERDLPR